MDTVSRLNQLAPWNNVSEEDFYRVDGLWISIRGQIRRPEGAYFCASEEDARRLVFQPEEPVPPAVLRLEAATGAWSCPDHGRAEAALAKVLDQFEGKSVSGLEFPVTFNVEEE